MGAEMKQETEPVDRTTVKALLNRTSREELKEMVRPGGPHTNSSTLQ
eukprot:gene7622-23827_t